MTILTEDTAIQAEQIQLSFLRNQPLNKRIQIISQMYRAGLELEIAGIKLRHPEYDAHQILTQRLIRHFSDHTPQTIENYSKMTKDETNFSPFSITSIVIDTLNLLKIPYLIGGSLASSLHGEPRYTYDADLLVQMDTHHVDAFFETLKDAFYLDKQAILNAIANRSSFNLIHFESAFKVDIFISEQRPFDNSRFARRVAQNVHGESFDFSSPEDMILAKLEWYKMGGESSDKQWRDILGLLLIQNDKMDREYLKKWADSLGVAHILQRVITEAGLA